MAHLTVCRIRSIPSNIAFHVALFPDNVPLPTPKTTARIIGGAIHVVHLFISAHDTDGIWEDKRSSSWFDWVSEFQTTTVFSNDSLDHTYHTAFGSVLGLQRLQSIHPHKKLPTPWTHRPCQFFECAIRQQDRGPRTHLSAHDEAAHLFSPCLRLFRVLALPFRLATSTNITVTERKYVSGPRARHMEPD